MVDGVDVVQQVHSVLDKIKAFSEQIRSGELRGATGKRIRNIVAVGIGGSYLGPACIHEVFKTEEEGSRTAQDFQLRFLSNVDPVDVSRAQVRFFVCFGGFGRCCLFLGDDLAIVAHRPPARFGWLID